MAHGSSGAGTGHAGSTGSYTQGPANPHIGSMAGETKVTNGGPKVKKRTKENFTVRGRVRPRVVRDPFRGGDR